MISPRGRNRTHAENHHGVRLARCQSGDIDSAARALEQARHARIHVFLSTSPLHREHKLGMSKAQVVDAAVAAVERLVGVPRGGVLRRGRFAD
jgi:Isopropylmalate/homocitrate/citramalate synthases